MAEEANKVEEAPELHRIQAMRTFRCIWKKQGISEFDDAKEVWVAAGYTYSQQIAEEANQKKDSKTFGQMVPPEYRDFAKVFSEVELERLPVHKPWDHAIDLKPGAPENLRSKIYSMPPNEQQELDQFIKENLCKGYIRPSKSLMASPVFFMKKKDGKLRLVQNYRQLNKITVKNWYPLPLAMDIVNRLHGAKYFTKFDVHWGYSDVRIKKGDKWKATFASNQGLFEPTVMFDTRGPDCKRGGGHRPG